MNNLAFTCIEKKEKGGCCSAEPPMKSAMCSFGKFPHTFILPAGDKVSTANVAEGTVQRERDQDKEHVNKKLRDICPYLHIKRQLQKLP